MQHKNETIRKCVKMLHLTGLQIWHRSMLLYILSVINGLNSSMQRNSSSVFVTADKTDETKRRLEAWTARVLKMAVMGGDLGGTGRRSPKFEVHPSPQYFEK